MHNTVQSRVLYNTVVYCRIQYSTLYNTVVYCIIQYIVLYSTEFYSYTILYGSVMSLLSKHPKMYLPGPYIVLPRRKFEKRSL